MATVALMRPLAVSLGDPAGVGPEIVVKAWSHLREHGPRFMVVGDYAALGGAAPRGGLPIRRVSGVDEAAAIFSEALPVLDIPLTNHVVAGQPSPLYATAVVRWIETAVGLALSGAVAGVVTAPISKAPLYQAGFSFPGHTEFLAN